MTDMGTEIEKINILLVDDNPGNLIALETILQAPDRNLIRASSGEEALRYLLDHDAAVILLDVHMPIIDGLETAALIRGRERTRNVPIIFLTAYDSAGKKHVSQGYSLGAVDYIVKPIDPEALKSKVAVFVELYRRSEQVKEQAELLRVKNIEQENANLQRLSRLIDLGQQLAAERDPEKLLTTFCEEAGDILGARYTTIGILEEDQESLLHFHVCGLELEEALRMGLPQASQRFLSEQFKSRRSLRLTKSDLALGYFQSLPGHPPIKSFLGVPILQQDRLRGWLYLVDKLDAREFTEADEHFTITLSQAFVFYENARLYTETQRHAAALEQEITVRKQVERERAELLVREKAARREAETANRLKDEFLATVSHELRAPLNAILGWVTLVRSGSLNDEDRARALDTVERNSRAQKRLIDDLLEVSRIITGKLRLDMRLIDLVSVVESAVESVRPAAEAKGVNLRTVIEPKNCRMRGDSSRLQQVIWNLLTNGIKFTPAGGSVEVRLKSINNHMEISVKDTGVGINPEFLPYAFDRFRQADGSSTRKHGGLGLGLAIVRHLVEMHGGNVKAESAGEGQGATFTIVLPIITADAEPVETPPLFQVEGDNLPPASAPRLAGLRVMVVDDDMDTLDLLQTILTQSGAEVRSADKVTEALKITSSWEPEIVISDISMPGEDGYDLVEQLRKQMGQKIIPTLALTAYAGAEDRIRALAAGFQMHLQKPVEPDELIITIAALTGRLALGQANDA
jgi:signal transduction histidine kinase/DNA-binding response OmpR family regulator